MPHDRDDHPSLFDGLDEIVEGAPEEGEGKPKADGPPDEPLVLDGGAQAAPPAQDPSGPALTPWILLPGEIPADEVGQDESVEVTAEPVPFDEIAEIASTMPWLAETAVRRIDVEEVPIEEAPDVFGGTERAPVAASETFPPEIAEPEDHAEIPETQELGMEPEAPSFATESAEESAAVMADEGAAAPFADEDLLASDWSWEEAPATARGNRIRKLWPVAAIAAAAVAAVALWPTIHRLVRHTWSAEAGREVAATPAGGTGTPPPDPAVALDSPRSVVPESEPEPDSSPAVAAPPDGPAPAVDEGELRLIEAVRRCLLLGIEGPKEG